MAVGGTVTRASKEGKEGEESTDTDGKGPNEMEYLRPLSTCQPTFLNEGRTWQTYSSTDRRITTDLPGKAYS